MKRITVTIGSEDIEEMLREKLATEFPHMEIENTSFPYVADMTIRLRRKPSAEEVEFNRTLLEALPVADSEGEVL